MQDEKRKLLIATAEGFNSNVIMLMLRDTVRKGEKLSSASDVEVYNTESKTLRKISQIMYKYSPKREFWNEFLNRSFRDMELFNFESQPSINRTSKRRSVYFENANTKTLDCCESISLMQHTLNLLVYFLEHLQEKVYFNKFATFDILMSCLLHDFGKSLVLQERYLKRNIKKNENSHQDESSSYIEMLKNEIEFALKEKYSGVLNDEIIIDIGRLKKIRIAVLEHHEKNVTEHSLSDALQMIDRLTRENEFKNYINEQK